MRTFIILAVAALFSLLGCAPESEATATATQAGGGIWFGIPSLPGGGIPTTDPCEHGNDRVLLVGLSFQCPACRYNDVVDPSTRPTPSLSTEGSTPWYPQLVRTPATPRNYWAYRDIEVSSWIATVEALWPVLHPTSNGAMNNFHYPTPGYRWLFEPNPLWMQWKGGDGNVFTTDGFDNAGRMLYGESTYHWGTANMIRGGYRTPPHGWGIWYERWLLLCRNGGIQAGDALPYLDMHTDFDNPRTQQVVIRRHPAGRCPRVTYSCEERLIDPR